MATQGKDDIEGVKEFASTASHGELSSGDVTVEYLSPEEDKRILRKVDLWLLPIMAVSYFFQFLDKTALGTSAILKLRQDLHLSGSEYSWSNSMYYFGYLAGSYPAALLMLRWPVGKLIAGSMLVWGVVLMLTATCFNAGSLLATRFFLGLSEAPIAPALAIIVSMWYKPNEQPLRHAAWFAGTILASVLGNLTSYGLGHVQSIAPWKAIFLIYGAITIAWSACIYFLLPDAPMNASFLNEEDRNKAILRVKNSMTGIKSNEFKWQQFIEALTDVKSWLIVLLMFVSNIPNGAGAAFSSIVTVGFGFTPFNALLLGCIPAGLHLIVLLLSTGGSSYFRNTRTYFVAFNYSFGIVGAVLVRFLPHSLKWSRFVGGMFISTPSANFPLIMSLITANFGGFTKKTTLNAMVFIVYCAGNIIGPQLFFAWQAPNYESGFLAIIICLSIGFCLSFIIRYHLMWENHQRDRKFSSIDIERFNEENRYIMVNLTDKTDKDIPQFRYAY